MYYIQYYINIYLYLFKKKIFNNLDLKNKISYINLYIYIYIYMCVKYTHL